jgi:ubiquinone biosynthesis protein
MIGFYFRQLRHVRRYNQILSVLIKYGFDDYVTYLEETHRFPLFRKILSRFRKKSAIKFSKWEKMRKVCEELGPTFVKFGQILSSRPDLIPDELALELQKLQDSVPPFPSYEVVEILEREFGKPVEELFHSFEMVPIASASMAQVHRAVLRNGKVVAVKVQRPGIQKTIRQDILIMRDIAVMLSKRIPSLNQFDAVGLVNNFAESINKELDFIHETWSMQRFMLLYRTDEKIFVPKTHKELCSAKVITQDFVVGKKITDIKSIVEEGLDPNELGLRVIRSFYQQIFEFGFFHADPHPGNLFAMKNNVVGYLDFGMMGSIMHRDLENLGNLILAIEEGNIKRIIRYVHFLGDITQINDSRALEFDVHEFVGKYSVQDRYQENISDMLLDLKDIILKHHLKVPAHFFLLTRAMVNAEGIVRQLNPNVSLADEIRPFIIGMIRKDHGFKAFGKRMVNFASDFSAYLEDFPHDLKQVMTMIKNGEIRVDLEHKGIDPFLFTLERLTRQMILTVMISSLVIGSSLLVISNVQPVWYGMSAWAWFGFSGALVLLIIMITSKSATKHLYGNGNGNGNGR